MVQFNRRSRVRSCRVFERLEPRMMLAGDTIPLGLGTFGGFDQPYVDIEMYDGNSGIGPYDAGFGIYPYNHILLDTGANSIMIVSDAATDLASNGYSTEGAYHEQGVAGYMDFDVSAPYRFDVTGSDGVTHTLPQTSDQVRILSNPDIHLGGLNAQLGGIPGLVGMPAMVDRVTTLDMTGWEGGGDIFEMTGMEVTFSDTLPEGNGHRYSVPVDDRVAFDVEDGRPPDAPLDSPLPVWAPIPFMTGVAEHLGKTVSGNFLFDTGAQMSMISSDMAFALGLDEDGDGNFVNEQLYTLPIGGVGGTMEVPVMLVEKLALPTEQGVDLAWMGTNPDELGLELLVLDIDPSIDGVFGVDLLTGGVTVLFDPDTFEFVVDGAPYFDQVHFDFRDMMNGSGTLHFDLNAVYDQIVPGASAEVTGRYAFYNNSGFDGRQTAVNAADQSALATDKQALLPGETASAANVTSYSRGINGLMIDIDNLADPEWFSAADLQFRVSDSSNSGAWTAAPEPSAVRVWEGQGDDGADRVVITWDDHAIVDQWLEVTVLANGVTGLDQADVFCFGNAVGDADGSGGVDLSDFNLWNAQKFTNVEIDAPADFDRSGAVDLSDFNLWNAHKFSAIPTPVFASSKAGVSVAAADAVLSASDGQDMGAEDLAWLDGLSLARTQPAPPKDDSAAGDIVDKLLASYWP